MLEALREALAVSPENALLRKHFAEMLAAHGRTEEASRHYTLLLEENPKAFDLRLGLAKAYWAEGQYEKCLPLVNAFMDEVGAPPEALILYARVQVHFKEYDAALHAYNQAVSEDSAMADKALLEQMHAAMQPSAPATNGVASVATVNNLHEQLFGYLERPQVTFANVGGLETLKETIRNRIVYPFQNPELYRTYGREAGGGLLLYGPPGVGKTFLARATAGEINAAFISVGVNDVLDMWVGNSEKRLHNFFTYARKHAPCILFFDEIDALAASREKTKNATMNTIVNQFLAEFDGVKHSNDGVLVIGATNALWKVDGI